MLLGTPPHGPPAGTSCHLPGPGLKTLAHDATPTLGVNQLWCHAAKEELLLTQLSLSKQLLSAFCVLNKATAVTHRDNGTIVDRAGAGANNSLG